ncbi:MAG: prenyltransferase/squalene oxidase repeat-containing protein [Planctomycetota bacterium]|nr:prenyltransferase/squalene oxidase repeat-containing protein [Planctomycetota bacterium]
MTGPAAHADRPEMVTFSLESRTPLPDVSELPVVTLTETTEEIPAADVIHETVGVNPNVPMRVGSIWLDGESLMCSCPDCLAPVTIRHWLMVADCWNCGTAVLLSAEQEQVVKQLMKKTSGEGPQVRQSAKNAGPSHSVALPYYPAAMPSEAASRLRTMLVYEDNLHWARRAVNQTPAWIISLLAHILVLILLGLFYDTDTDDGEYITLSVVVGDVDREGGNVTNLTPEAEDNYELPPPENIDPNNPEEMEKVNQDREVAEQLQKDFDTSNPNLPDIDSVKRRINEATGTNKTILARDPRVRKQVVAREGGTSATEAAVARGLEWLARHQEPGGHWSLHKFNSHAGCTCQDPGRVITDAGATSLALLPFLGAGQTHIAGMYKDQVRNGLDYLLDNQAPDGDLSAGARGNTRMYTHGQAAIVLCEAYMMSGDQRLKQPAQNAITFIIASQHNQGGWRYNPGQAGDTSVVGWQIMALQSARAAGLEVPISVLQKSNEFLNSVQAPNQLYAYQPRVSPTHVMTAEAILCRYYLGHGRNASTIDTGIKYLIDNHLPKKGGMNIYYLYYGTQVMHHYGGPEWDLWNEQMRELLIETQHVDSHRRGSWTPKENHDRQGGRLYATAMAVCCLEVYYRHLPIFRKFEVK